MAAELLAAVRRGAFDESLHLGHVAVVESSGDLRFAAGDPDTPVFLRSAAKPFQALALVLSGAADRFSLDSSDIAVACASHTAEPVHLTQVQRLLSLAGVPEEALQCGAHPPGDRESADLLRQNGQAPTSIHSNCSGKHAGMLAAAKAMGADLGTYLSPDSPVQRMVRALFAEISGIDEADIGIAVDGCSAPVLRVPLSALALAFARLARPDGLREPLAAALFRVRYAMMAHPYLVAGRNRIGPEIMAAGSPRLVAKTGAEAVFAVGDLSRGLGLAIKVADGSERAMGPALVESLLQSGFLHAAEAEALGRWHRPELHNYAGILVGGIEPRVRLRISG